ncbi:FAD-binding oxidoreductase, partial [Roseisolibacter sp. H3M3-2]|uniref:FAD-binding oxidoreductase n=1 Tax=Roseisolibacter sp. H3M3-2 TaxID=3031323 RepID=UPI0023DA780F
LQRAVARALGGAVYGLLALAFAMSLLGVWGTRGASLPAPAAAPVVRDVTGLSQVRVARVVAPTSLEALAAAVRDAPGAVSVGGGRYSMGGQTATPDGVQLDLRRFRGVVALDTAARTLTVRAGTTWREVQQAIDPHGLAVQVMQTYNSFTVGGALSVNAHGRYVGRGPVSSTVRALRLVLADGSVVTASRDERPELFWAALGGYGGVGVIAEATLALAPNARVRREDATMPVAEYLAWFRANVRDDTTAVFHNADLAPPTFDAVRAVTYRTTDAPLTDTTRLRPADQASRLHRWAYAVMSQPRLGPWAREHVIEPMFYRGGEDHPVTWRNNEASYDVSELEPASRLAHTFVLQEFFVPVDSLVPFTRRLAPILRDSVARAINVSIRHAHAEPQPYLTWAPTETFAFVLYYRQPTTAEAQRAVGRWTRTLVDAALASGGRHYLPYQPHATRAQFARAYPRAPEYFAVKRAADPAGKFTNVLWDLYAPAPDGAAPPVSAARLPAVLPAEVRLALDTLPDYYLSEARTWMTHPEWDLVYSSEAYGRWLRAGRAPSAFPYARALGTFWRAYVGSWRWTAERAAVAPGTHLMLAVIGTSTAVEYGLKGLYENTVGRLTEALAPAAPTPEERVAAAVNAEYAEFIAVRPWYEYDYARARAQLMAAVREPGPDAAPRVERRLALGLEFLVKQGYAALIGGGTHAVYQPDADRRWIVVAGAADSATRAALPTLRASVPLDRGDRALAAPRYGPYRDALLALARDPAVRVVELSGAGHVAVTGTAPRGWRPPPGTSLVLATPAIDDPGRVRFLLDVRVPELLAALREVRAPAAVDHVYDY